MRMVGLGHLGCWRTSERYVPTSDEGVLEIEAPGQVPGPTNRNEHWKKGRRWTETPSNVVYWL